MEIKQITPAEAIHLLDAGEAIPVDVREQDEYEAAHVPGARLLTLSGVRENAERILPDKDAKYYVYCRTGRRSETACGILADMGYTDISNLGGMIRWPYETESGLPDETGAGL